MKSKNVEVREFLESKPGYLKKSNELIAKKLDTTEQIVSEVKKDIRLSKLNPLVNTNKLNILHQKDWSNLPALMESKYKELIKSYPKQIQDIIRAYDKQELYKYLDPKSINSPKPYTKGNPDNVLIVGDVHSPFELDGYLEFCREQQEKFDCGTVVFIGDLVDGNSWSYHEHDPDGIGQNEEINQARESLKRWFHTFPVAKCTLGNHDLLITRKAKTHGLSMQFIRSFNEIWGAPSTWEFGYDFVINNVRYVHGDIGDAIKVAVDSRISTVQGHLHTKAFVNWSVSERDRIFGLQVGCGIDHKKYAFAYAKPLAKKPIISCGVVLEKGTLPINLLMNL